MKCSRWIALCVDANDHPVVGMQVPPPPALDKNKHAQSPFAAWVDLLSSVNWKDSNYNNKGTVIVLKRGEFVAGRAYWSKRWNWTEHAVRGFFSRLAENSMIEFSRQSQGHSANVASVCNYDTYQTPKPASDQSDRQSTASQPPDSYQDTQLVSNSAGATANETDAGNGVIVNCETIRHEKFVIDLKAVELQTFGAIPMAKIKSFAEGFARQWALELAAGQPASKVLPTSISNTIRWAIQNNQTAEEIAEIRKSKTAAPAGPTQQRPHKPAPTTVRHAQPLHDDVLN